MSENKCYPVYGSRVTVIPGVACEKIISGSATLTDVRVLTAFYCTSELNGKDIRNVTDVISDMTGLPCTKVETALAFWRGCGAVEIYKANETAVCEDDSDNGSDDVKTETAKPAKLSGKDIPKYSGAQISEMLDRDGGKMKSMIDQCQQLLGRMFNTVEISAMVGMCDWLGLDTEFIVTMTAYYTKKKPGCNVRYLEKAATDLVNNGITTLEELDGYLKEMEQYDGIAGKLRSWLGIGGRAYTQKENGMIKRWVKDYSFSDEVIRYAYEVTVDSKGEFNFAYADKILENWFRSGVHSRSEAEAEAASFRRERDSAKDGGSFDTDEFFSLALKRSYSGMKKDGGK